MKVRDVMSTEVESCHPGTNLATVAMVMWRRNCGVVPVVSSDTQRTLGVITDRDICMAVATKHRAAGDITVAEVFAGIVHTCGPDDDVAAAMETMRARQVRRLPVVDDEGRLQGVLSLYDLLVHGCRPGPGRHARIAESELLSVVHGICEAAAPELAPTRPARRRAKTTNGKSPRRTAA
jgi:CBS domain-containing protein